MKIQLWRHATLLVHYANRTLLVDPMLSAAEAMDPVGNASNTRRIPMVELPFDTPTLLASLAKIDAVLVTHTHRDHWDARAIELLPRTMPLIGQPADKARFEKDGFTNLNLIEDSLNWQGITITRTGGQHGTGEIGRQMGTVSGFVLRAPGAPGLYIAGDTIWCAEVESALTEYHPDVTIVNAGAATFLTGDPITMSAEDVVHVCEALPSTRVIAVHMETVNHCLLTRAALRQHLESAQLTERVIIPADGETYPARPII
jgi:L-ascorbate metabolism protein UlaG (beta-lactamase superfamily)